MSLTKASYSMVAGAPVNVLDYGADPTGVADSQPAIVAAIAAAGYRGKVFIPAGVYSISSSISLSTGTAVSRPVEIYGAGIATQIVNNAPANNPCFNFSKVANWYIHDLLLSGNTSHPNDGLWGVGAGTFTFTIERLTLMMPGYGIKLSDANTGSISDCVSWPTFINASPVPSVQPINTALINHHLYLTGSFVNDLSVYDCVFQPSVNYAANARGIRLDSTNSNSLAIVNCDVETYSGSILQTEIGIELINANNFVLQNIYNEKTQVVLDNCYDGTVNCLSDGGSLGIFALKSNSVRNNISNIYQDYMIVGLDATCNQNMFVGCTIRNSYSDVASPPNVYIGCQTLTQSGKAPRGLTNIAELTAVAGVYTPDCAVSTTMFLRPGASAFTVAAPLNPIKGGIITVTIQNGSGGALGAVTWNGIYKLSAWTNPATGYNRSITFQYDPDYGWRQISQTGVDVLN
jgi:hypothetical protein